MAYQQNEAPEFEEHDYTEFIAVPSTEVLVDNTTTRTILLYMLFGFLLIIAVAVIFAVIYFVVDAYKVYVPKPAEQRMQPVPVAVEATNTSTFRDSSMRLLRGHYRLVSCLTISPDGRYILSGEGDQQYIDQNSINRLDISQVPDKNSLPMTSTAYDLPPHYCLYVWESGMTKPQKLLKEHKSPLAGIEFNHQGNKAASIDIRGNIVLWNTSNWSIIDRYTASERQKMGLGTLLSVHCLAFSPNDQFLAIGGTQIPGAREKADSLNRQATVILWDIQQRREKVKNDDIINPQQFYTFPSQADCVFSLDYTRNGLYLIAGISGARAGVYILDAHGKVTPALDINKNRSSGLMTIPGSEQQAEYSSGHDTPSSAYLKTALRFDDQRIAAGDNHGRVSLWDFKPELDDPLKKVTCIDFARPFENLDRNVREMKYSNDGKYLISCGEELSVRDGNIDKLKLLGFLTPEGDGLYKDKPYYVYSIAFSPDGNSLLAGCSDTMIRIWDMNTLPSAWRPATQYDIENRGKVYDTGNMDGIEDLEFKPKKK